MGNIINKLEYVFHISDKINQCLGIGVTNKKTDINVQSKVSNSIEEEFKDYDIVDINEIQPYTFSKQNK
jgi:hypothetical protein